MADAASPAVERSRDVTWSVAGMLGLLIVTALATVPLTLTILHSRESDALVIDMAGRQRMLLERYMKEVLLAAQGRTGPYEETRAMLREHLHALIHGGPVVARPDGEETAVLPGAPSREIRLTLLRQERLLHAFIDKAEIFLLASRQASGSEALLDELLADNAALLDTANEAVVLLTRHSDARLRALIPWEWLVVVLVVTLVAFRTWRFLQTDRALKQSQASTMDALRQRDAVKSALLSSVSHDLRTPLTAIKTMVFGLQHPSSTASGHREEFLADIDRQVDYLNRLVGNLLDMSRLESGTLTPCREWHVCDELVEGAIRRVDVLLAGRPLDVRLAQDLPPVHVDGVQIQQVLINLLDNAIKFSPPGSPIRIAASLTGPALEVSVSNHGEGIPGDQLDRIFDRFYRVQSGRSAGPPGTGLGLAICKGIIEAHGGQILARSVPGVGTTILFRLPLTAPPSVRDAAPEPAVAREV